MQDPIPLCIHGIHRQLLNRFVQKPLEIIFKSCRQALTVYYVYQIQYTQFYIQLVYRPHFGTSFFCLGCLGCPGSKEKKWIEVFLSNFLRVVFSTFYGQKKGNNSFKYFSVSIEKLHKKSFYVFFFLLSKS